MFRPMEWIAFRASNMISEHIKMAFLL